MNTSDSIIDLSHLGFLSISGIDSQKFLQGQFTCDLSEISATQTCLGAHCNPQGRIISLFRLFWYQEQYFLQMPLDLIPLALNALKKYGVFFKTVLTNASDSLKSLGYVGNELNTIIPQLPLNADEAVSFKNLLIIKLPGLTTRYEIIGSPEDIKQIQAPTAALEAWKSIDLQSCIPTIYAETSEKFLPHDINLPRLKAVSFKKGCYTGQEIIARMEYRAKLKNHLYFASVSSDSAPVRGASLYQGQNPVGNIVDFCQMGYNNYEMLIIAQESDVKTKTLALHPESTAFLEFK